MASEIASEIVSENLSYPALNSLNNNSIERHLKTYVLPGYGSKTKEECNTVTSADYCPSCHRTVGHYYHCKNFHCPECYRAAAYQAAVRAADRLAGCHKAWRAIGKNLGYTNHIELSVPESEYQDFDKKKMIARAIKNANGIGISGGGLNFHAYRIKREYKRPIQRAISAAKKKMGSWEAIHENILGLPSVSDYLVFSPHFHIVGYFKMKQKSNEFYKETGWTYKNISWSKGRGSENQEGVTKIFAYLLTHHAINPEVEGRKGRSEAIHYFGAASKNKVSRETWKEKQDKKCTCGEQMYRIAIWSEERIQQIQEGLHKIELDEFNPKSKITIVHNKYRVRTFQATVETQFKDDSPGPGGFECP